MPGKTFKQNNKKSKNKKTHKRNSKRSSRTRKMRSSIRKMRGGWDDDKEVVKFFSTISKFMMKELEKATESNEKFVILCKYFNYDNEPAQVITTTELETFLNTKENKILGYYNAQLFDLLSNDDKSQLDDNKVNKLIESIKKGINDSYAATSSNFEEQNY